MDTVTAAVLADVAFEAVGEAIQFSTQRYRERIEQIRQTGEIPLPARSQIASYPTPTTDVIAPIVSVISPVARKLLRMGGICCWRLRRLILRFT
jgi:hypothetical protein